MMKKQRLAEQWKRNHPIRVMSTVGLARIPSEAEIARRREQGEWPSRGR
jgi:GTP cyclohydrolase III